jgi:hypothetical protein
MDSKNRVCVREKVCMYIYLAAGPREASVGPGHRQLAHQGHRPTCRNISAPHSAPLRHASLSFPVHALLWSLCAVPGRTDTAGMFCTTRVATPVPDADAVLAGSAQAGLWGEMDKTQDSKNRR